MTKQFPNVSSKYGAPMGRRDKLGLQDAQLTERPDAYDLAAFVEGYLTCAVWSSLDDDGSPLDHKYSTADLTTKARAAMRRDCRAFVRENLVDLQASGQSADQSGHDFWLTRNRHGAGFWDRGLGEIGDRLTKAAQAYGSSDVYVHRKRLHIS